MTTKDKATAAALREAADHMHNVNAAIAEGWRREADRLDPPAPTGKTVTWSPNGETHFAYWRDESGDIVCRRVSSPPQEIPELAASREFLDAVVLPLLADASDGPVPDEMARRAWDTYLDGGTGMDGMRAALEAVRGLPGMAVVRAGTPPEVLAWGAMHLGQYGGTVQMLSRTAAVEYVAKAPVHRRVVAIIADPGEGTA